MTRLNSKCYQFCYECENFKDRSCEKHERIASYFLPVGEDLKKDLGRIEAGEAVVWPEERESQWSCASCGSPIFWHATRCPSCEELVKPF